MKKTPDHINRIIEFGNESHFDRLMCHVNEKLDLDSINHPMNLGYLPFHIAYVDVESRSAYNYWIWSHIEKSWIDEWPTARMHFFLRMFNVIYMSLIIGISLFLFQSGVKGFDSNYAFLPLILIPTFWHFTSHNSNHGIMISHFLPWLFISPHIARARPIKWYVWCWLGLSMGIAICTGRSGLVFFAICVALIAIRIGYNILIEQEKLSVDIRNYPLVAFSTLMPVIYLRDTKYIQEYVPKLIKYASFDSSFLKIIAALIVAPSIFFATIFLVRKIIVKKPVKAKIYSSRISSTLCFLLLVAFFLPLIKTSGNLPSIEPPADTLNLFSYLRKILKFFWLQQGLGGNDFFLIESFWGGFGCPEPVWPSYAVQILKAVPIVGLIASFQALRKKPDPFETIVQISLLALSMLYLLLLGFGVYSDLMNIHGRYLLPFYILFMNISIPTKLLNSSIGPGTFLKLGATLVPVVSLYFVLSRYF